MAKKRLHISGLAPGEAYAIQVRAVDGGDDSQWSVKHDVNTISDLVGSDGQPRYPSPPTLTTWDTATGFFVAEWTNVMTMTDGSVPAIRNYEMHMTADVGGTPVDRVMPHYGVTNVAGGHQRREFTLGTMTAMFGGVPGNIALKVRAVNQSNNAGEFSNELNASMGVPDPPTDAVPPPTAEGMMEAVKLRWTPPANMNFVTGYRVYWSTDPNFTPGPAFKSYEGPANEFTLTSGTYSPHYFKIRSYSAWGTESTDLLATATPKSPYGPDDTAPTVPVMVTPLAMDRTVLTNPKVVVSWTHNRTTEQNKDTMGYVVSWKSTADTVWRNSYFDQGPETGTHSGIIDLPRPFSNYQFKVAAYDFVANYSAYTAVETLNGNVGAPSAVTNFRASSGLDSIRYDWDTSSSLSVQYGGKYQIQFRTTNSFPADTPIEYTTAATSLNVSGLDDETPYYARIRAVDADGQVSPWTTVLTKSTTAFPIDPTSDGLSPTATPVGVKATGGLNYINVAWTQITTNPDPLVYEVHIGASNGFAVSNATLAGVSAGTSFMVDSTITGQPLVQGTTYYFRVRAKDADGVGPESATVSAVLSQVAGEALGINMAGENLYFNSSFDVDSALDGIADYWAIYNNSAGTEPTTGTLVTGRNGVGFAQRVTWTGVNSTQKGIMSSGAQVLRPLTEYVLSFYARASAGTGFTLHWNNPQPTNQVTVTTVTPSSTVWNRYVYRFTTPATVNPENVYISIAGHTASGGWVEFDDAQIEAGSIASAYKLGTVSIAKLATGKFQTADFMLSTGGTIRSENYNFAAKTGFLLSESGLNLLSGTVRAQTLEADSTFTNNLNVASLFTIGTGGNIRSTNYNTTNKTGFNLSSAGLDIQSGTVRAGTLIGGTISSPDIIVGANGKLTIDSTGSIVSSNYLSGLTGWKISSTGIEMWDVNSKINVNALETSTLTSTIITLGSGGTIQSNAWASGVGSRWQLADAAFTMVGGTITGSTVITNQLYSEGMENIGGINRYKFSINSQGYAEFSGARVYGNMTVGSGATNFIQSDGYNGASGWKILGDGSANFFNMNTWNLNVYGASVVGAGNNYIKSANYDGANGWAIRGDGYADFWGGVFAVGGIGGGQIRLTNWGSGEALIQLFVPGTTANYHHIMARGYDFHIRGGYGGAIVMDSANVIRGGVHMVIDFDIWAGRNLNAGNQVNTPNIGGDPVFNHLSTGGGQTAAVLGNSGRLARGTSSKRYKNSIESLDLSVKQVLSLKPKTFKWNDVKEFGNARYPGFIAEEAQEAGLEEFVTYEEVDGKFIAGGFRYAEFSAAQQVVLIKHEETINELKAEIEHLKKLFKAGS